jgi:hypothetical protein
MLALTQTRKRTGTWTHHDEHGRDHGHGHGQYKKKKISVEGVKKLKKSHKNAFKGTVSSDSGLYLGELNLFNS